MCEWGHTGVLVCSDWLVVQCTKCWTVLDFVRFGTAPVQVILYCIDPSIPYHSNSNGVILLEFVRFGTVTCLYKYIDKYMYLLEFVRFSMLSSVNLMGLV